MPKMRDHFVEWLKKTGAKGVAELAGVTNSNVRAWRIREAAPRPEIALRIIERCTTVPCEKPLTWADIYEPYARIIRRRNRS